MPGFTNKLKNILTFNNNGLHSLNKIANHMTVDSLQSFATRNNLRVQRTEKGDFVSTPIDNSGNTFMSFYESWCSTYSNTGSFEGRNKDNIYALYDVMDENMTEASMMLDTYAEEAISFGVIDDAIQVHVSDPKAEEILLKVLSKNKILRRAKSDIRTMCKYGDAAYALEFPKSLFEKYNELSQEEKDNTDPSEFFNVMDLDIYPVKPKNLKINADTQNRVINYTVDNSLHYDNSRQVSSKSLMQQVFQPWQLARFTIEDDMLAPYGRSILYSLRTLFDQLSTLEALLAMTRANKVQRLVVKVPVPGGNAIEAFNQISRAKAMFKSTIFSDAVGTKSGRKVAGLTETFFIPSGPDYSIETIKSEADLASTEDVDHFLEKALRATKLPKGFFSGEESGEDSGAALAERDQKFAKALLQVQNAYTNGLVDLCACILAHAGFLVNELEIEVTIERPSKLSKNNIEEYKSILEFASAVKESLQPDSENVKYPITNYAQLLILLGIPLDYVKLCIAKNPICVVDNSVMWNLFKDLEVKLYNYDKSNRFLNTKDKRNDKGELIDPDAEEKNSETSLDTTNSVETSNDNSNNEKYSDVEDVGDWLRPDHHDVASVSNSKDLRLTESGVRKVVSRSYSSQILSSEPQLKQMLTEVANDLRGKKSLNG